MKTPLSVVPANKGPIITATGFSNYDHCLNPYVGCQFGCTYCYVRFFVKDKDHAWGDFVRTRDHLLTRLPKDITKIGATRLVIGTMTDPYQPIEKEEKLTRSALEILLDHQTQMNKVGIFTRSPLVLRDAELIKRLPRGRVHFTITPYPREILKIIEPIPVMTEARFRTVKALKQAGIRVHVSVAPALPIISESFTDQFANQLADAGVDEFFVDPMQPYKESFDSIREAMAAHPQWAQVEQIVTDREEYTEWKVRYSQQWLDAWQRVQSRSPHTLPIMADHVSHTKIDMRDGTILNWKSYGDN
jgi:DNA repair photolyase